MDLGKFDIEQFTSIGLASAEAEVSKTSPKEQSLRADNPENVVLAGKRLQDTIPLIEEAIQKARGNASVVQNGKHFAIEQNLSDPEISDLARVADAVLGGTTLSPEKAAYELITEINRGNTAVINAVNANPDFVDIFKRHIEDARGVNISFEAETEYEKTDVFNVAIALPLLAFLLPAIRFEVVGGRTILVPETITVMNPDIQVTELRRTETPVARRLFSETTPDTLDQPRSFDQTYSSIDLSSQPERSHAMLQHLLLEEVLPSLRQETREPLTDYLAIANNAREFLHSDARKDSIAKGSYATPEDAQRKMTEMIIEMWERHDAATYPMEGIDIKAVINYRDSEHVVAWAKTLAYEFTRIAQETHTTDEFRDVLVESIRQSLDTRGDHGGVSRNVFVRSDPPRE